MLSDLFKTIALMLPVFVFVFFYRRIKKSFGEVLINLYLITIVSASLLMIGKDIYKVYHQPYEWDFLGFWLNGKVALSGENFYDAGNYQKIALPFEPGDEFRKEIIDVGFWYPPFSMFLFIPLGFIDNLSKAYLFWQIINLLLCCICTYELWKLSLKELGLLGFLLIAALMLRMMPTWATFHFAQTNFLNLLFFLYFLQNKSKASSGIWLTLSVVVKPYMAVLYLYPLITRKWKILISATLTFIAITLLSFLVFGLDSFVSYISNPVPKTPSWIYTEWTNPSLLATILRSSELGFEKGSPIFHPLFVGGSLVLLITTGLFVLKRRNPDDNWIIFSTIFLTLIVYPASQIFYSVFLIVPIALLLQYPTLAAKERTVLFLIILAIFILAGRFNYVFYANLFMWLISIIFMAKRNNSLSKDIQTDMLKINFAKTH